MLLRILKKDLLKRKGVNIILFLFITLATVFLASSVNNILVVFSGVDYYMEYSNVPDVNVVTSGNEEKEQIDDWLSTEASVKEFDHNNFVSLSDSNIKLKKDNQTKGLKGKGVSLYLGTQDADYNKVFDEEDNSFSLKEGEIAVPAFFLTDNKVEVNDKILLDVGGVNKEFTIKCIIKDIAYGNEMAGMMRLIVGQTDYERFAEKADKIGLYYINTFDIEEFKKNLGKKEFATVTQEVEKAVYKMMYSFDMIMAGLLILIGICLILIALLVLRFTLVFTMEEDYQEIGIMKAVGFRSFAIKKIHLLKYLVLVVAGAMLGLLCSFPVASAMVKSVSVNIIMEKGSENIWANIVSACAVVAIVMVFCFFSANKLNKVSAITAIRGGETGERFSLRRGISLYKRKKMPIPIYLGANDILSRLRRYIVLVVTFCISFILITLPLNTLNTMSSDEMAEKFMLNMKGAVYVREIEQEDEANYTNAGDFEKGMNRVESELKKKGYHAELMGIVLYFFKFSEKGSDETYNLIATQAMGGDTSFLSYQEGTAPMLSNEVAFSKKVMKDKGWNIGDTVKSSIGGTTKDFIITGIYSDYMQLGESVRLNPAIDLRQENIMYDYWNIMVDMDTEETQDIMAAKLNKELPRYEWVAAQDIVNQSVGGIKNSLEDMVVPMTAMLCVVVMLITVLMEKLFIVREKGEIAMMKSIGFRNQTIRSWQVLRMVSVVLVSMIISIPMSVLSNRWMLKPIFAIMGADIKIQVVPWLVYGLYPSILLVGIIAATIFATRSIRKIDIQGLNNLE